MSGGARFIRRFPPQPWIRPAESFGARGRGPLGLVPVHLFTPLASNRRVSVHDRLALAVSPDFPYTTLFRSSPRFDDVGRMQLMPPAPTRPMRDVRSQSFL